MKLQIHEVEKDAKYIVSASRLSGSAFAFNQTYGMINETFKNDRNKNVAEEEEKKE